MNILKTSKIPLERSNQWVVNGVENRFAIVLIVLNHSEMRYLIVNIIMDHIVESAGMNLTNNASIATVKNVEFNSANI